MQTETIENFLPLQQSSYGGLRKFVFFYKRNLVRLPEAILKAGVRLISNFRGRLGDEYYLVLEDLFHAAIECQQFEVAQFAITKLNEKFKDAPKTLKLNGIYEESTGDRDKAEEIYDGILKENPLNMEARKRKIAVARSDGKAEQAIKELNRFLQENFCEKEAWLELADLYLETLNYHKALYCYEQVCLLAPKNMYYFIRCAELLYTIGGHVNLGLARNYYTYALYFEEENLPGLLGLIRTCKALEAQKKGNAKNKEILELAQRALRKVYQTKNPQLLEKLSL